jgi:hypothetical protein
MEEEIEPKFQVHMLNDSGIGKASELASKFSQLLRFCQDVGGQGRETALVATKLEEACFFAKKAMANRPENQK